jgi:cobalamin biosynthesis protein CobC
MNSIFQSVTAGLPQHGGDLQSAATEFHIPVKQWLDLSTGINPVTYPVQDIPESVFYQLPYPQKEFIDAIHGYYQQSGFLAVCGTQSAIQVIPELLNTQHTFPVLLPSVGYKEHERYWARAGNLCRHYSAMNADEMIDDISTALMQNRQQHLVLINPNNPTGVTLSADQILAWAALLEFGAFLIVDEAFIDATGEHSLLSEPKLPNNCIVLRSFGKFFGLAGLRVGFVFSSKSFRDRLKERLGIWQINGPAQWLATKALTDHAWQHKAMQELNANAHYSQRQYQVIVDHFSVQQVFTTDYFMTVELTLVQALDIRRRLGEQGILIRIIPMDQTMALIRMGNINRHDLSACRRLLKMTKALRTQAW